MNTWTCFKKIALLFSVCCLLQGCVEAAFSGASMAYNRYSLQNTINDNYTTMKISRALYIDNKRYKNTHISINTFDSEVLLTGQVPSAELHQELGLFVKKVSGTNKVYNLTTISPIRSSLDRMEDTWISTKINSQLLAIIEIDITRIKVVTEDRIVFLMGTVTPQQGKIANNVARHTKGVKAVVDIFSYIIKVNRHR